jgi:uncharacterized damage-inducible protein DinB
MIGSDHVRLMARYNAWQNQNLYGAAATLDDAERKRERGAFFGSIHATLNHILWGDQIWMHRLAGMPRPAGAGIPDSLRQWPEWSALRDERFRFDGAMLAWAGALDAGTLAADQVWFSAAAQREFRKPRWLLVTHMFNHQTHHRGQVHCLLTQAGARPADTDIALMPD